MLFASGNANFQAFESQLTPWWKECKALVLEKTMFEIRERYWTFVLFGKFSSYFTCLIFRASWSKINFLKDFYGFVIAD